MDRVFLVLGGVLGALGVGFGAFGAHGLRARLADVADGAARRAWWETAAHYHLIHALGLGLAAYVVARTEGSAASVAAGFCFLAGVTLFSGSLYAMTLTGVRALGVVTPIGGLFLIAGWIAIAVAVWRGT